MKMVDVNLKIKGMSCGGCVRRVELGLKKIPGVTVKEVKVGSARISMDEGTASVESVSKAIAEMGFEAAGAA